LRIWCGALYIVAIGLGIAGCAEGRNAADRGAGDVLVFAASDLQAAFAEVEARYEAATGQGLTIVFGSTGNLATQIAHGAPADLFFAANESFLDGLEAAGRIADDTRIVYAMGRLAIIWRPTLEPPPDVGALARPEFGTIAIGNPEHAPYGIAGREALRAAGVWDQVLRRLVYGENIAQTLQFVLTGNADAGLVALGLVLGPDPIPHVVVPETAHTPLRQAAAVVRDSPRALAARGFLDFVMMAEGQEILRRYGFDPPVP
jgi:molybdate transport system substrate-binding protein